MMREREQFHPTTMDQIAATKYRHTYTKHQHRRNSHHHMSEEVIGVKLNQYTTRSKQNVPCHRRYVEALLVDFHNYEFLETDSQYLLRLCQRNDWKNVEKCCAMLCQIFNDNEEPTAKLSLAAQGQVLMTDHWGNTALHVVCYHKPPVHVILALLQAISNIFINQEPSGGHAQRKFLMTNHHGATPLLIACRSGACQCVLQLLLDDSSRLLIHPDHRDIFKADHGGSTTFTGLVQRYTMLCKIPYFKRYCMSLNEFGITTTTTDAPETDARDQPIGNKTPVWFRSLSTPSSININSDHDHNLGRNDSYFLEDNQDASMIFPMLLENIGSLLDAAWNDAESHRESWKLRRSLGAGYETSSWMDHPLHVAGFGAGALPRSLLDLIFQMNDGERRESDNFRLHTTTHGIHPLHLAVLCPQSNEEHADVLSRRSYLIHRLLIRDPSAARLAMPPETVLKNSSYARLSFHQAIVSGWTWHIRSKGQINEENKVGPLQEWFQAAPELVHQRDAATGLYPFQLAAASAGAGAGAGAGADTRKENNRMGNSKQIEVVDGRTLAKQDEQHLTSCDHPHEQPWSVRAQLDTIFCLLKEAPELVIDSE